MTCLCHPQGSCTITRRPTTVPSTWRASATCSPPCPCSWSRWLSAGRPGTNWLRTGKKTAVRPTAASAPTACGTASCRKRHPGKAFRLEAACATRRVFNLWPLRQDGTVGSWFPWEPVEETEAPTHLRGRRCDFDETKSAKAKYCWTLFLTKQLYIFFFCRKAWWLLLHCAHTEQVQVCPSCHEEVKLCSFAYAVNTVRLSCAQPVCPEAFTLIRARS